MGFPTVKADRAFNVTFDYHHMSIADGQVLEGELARYLADTGAPVTVLDPGDDEPQAVPTGKTPDQMTAKELTQFAAANDIDLAGVKKKADVLAAVTAALNAAATDSEGTAGDTAGDSGDGDESGDDGPAGDSA